jgi:hypothetical protein
MKTFLYYRILIHINIRKYCTISKAIKTIDYLLGIKTNIYCRDVASHIGSKLRDSLLFLLQKNKQKNGCICEEIIRDTYKRINQSPVVEPVDACVSCSNVLSSKLSVNRSRTSLNHSWRLSILENEPEMYIFYFKVNSLSTLPE